MKYTWEEHDIFAGRQVAACNRTENYIVGYDPTDNSPRQESKYALISLRDGQIQQQGMTKLEMAKYLNTCSIRPNTLHDEDVGPKKKNG